MTILPLTYLGNTEYYAKLLTGDCIVDVYENYVKQTFRNRCEIMTANGTASLTVNVVKGSSIRKTPMRDMRIDNTKKWQHQHWRSLVSAYRNSPYFDHYEDYFAPFYEKRFEFLADLNIGLTETILNLLRSSTALHLSEKYVEAATGDSDMRQMFPAKNNDVIRQRTDGVTTDSNSASTANPYPTANNQLTNSPQTSGNQTASGQITIIQTEPIAPAVAHSAKVGIYTTEAGSHSAKAAARFRAEPYYQVFAEKFPFHPNLSVIDLLFCEGPNAVEIIKKSINR